MRKSPVIKFDKAEDTTEYATANIENLDDLKNGPRDEKEALVLSLARV